MRFEITSLLKRSLSLLSNFTKTTTTTTTKLRLNLDYFLLTFVHLFNSFTLGRQSHNSQISTQFADSAPLTKYTNSDKTINQWLTCGCFKVYIILKSINIEERK